MSRKCEFEECPLCSGCWREKPVDVRSCDTRNWYRRIYKQGLLAGVEKGREEAIKEIESMKE